MSRGDSGCAPSTKWRSTPTRSKCCGPLPRRPHPRRRAHARESPSHDEGGHPGSPCCDFSVTSHAKLGIEGKKSGLLREVFAASRGAPLVEHFVLENVANMLHLHGGAAMDELGGELLRMGF